MDDAGITAAIEWVVGGAYDRAENRFGRVAALSVSLVLAILLLGTIVAVAWYFLR